MVRAVVRKFWETGGLVRREDGTFVQSGHGAHDSRHRMERETARSSAWTRRSGASPQPPVNAAQPR